MKVLDRSLTIKDAILSFAGFEILKIALPGILTGTIVLACLVGAYYYRRLKIS